jgi:predicted 3-demethylubiquinone-9 3-methyltransferase (glyoxalase superfamily)
MTNLIYPCLWFDGKAKEAAEFYCSVFKNTIITGENQFVVAFESAGQKFLCLNGGPAFSINPSISFYVLFDTEQEVNDTWEKLLTGGLALMPLDKYEWGTRYGWVQDKFGVSWQLTAGRVEDVGQRITPMLLFTGDKSGKAEEAIGFYTSVFDHSGVKIIARYTRDDPDVEGTLKHSQFNLGKHIFMAMDSSLPHQFGFNEAISFVVDCETQKEIDYYWEKLTQGGNEGQCGWLKDRYGVSWQIVPVILQKLLSDPSRAERVTSAFLQMKKFNIEKLINA